MKPLRQLTHQERQHIINDDPSTLTTIEYRTRREYEHLDIHIQNNMLIVRPLNGSIHHGIKAYPADTDPINVFFDPPTPIGTIRNNGANRLKPWIIENEYATDKHYNSLNEAISALASQQ